MEKEITILELNNETIESMIYVIRGQKVMLDFELAKIYGYETKNFNRQVKNNIEKFDDDFRFQLNKKELDEIERSKKITSSSVMSKKSTPDSNSARCKNFTAQIWATNKGGRTSLPYAFTEQGIYMIMTVLKGDLAIRQSKALIRAFKQMKDYIVESNNLLLNTN